MNYPPKHHQETDFLNIIKTIRTFPLATLISAKNSKIYTTHLPLMYEETTGELGTLLGHIDKNNPHLELLQNGIYAQVLFHGPNAYISPTLFADAQFPTWNYVKVHITAKVTRMETNEELISSIADMTSFLETAETPYLLDTKSPRVHALAEFITGIRLEITAWEGKFKLSQDKTPQHKNIAAEALIQESRNDIAAFIHGILDT